MIPQLVAEIFKMLVVEPSFQIRPAIDAGRSVTLEVHEIARQLGPIGSRIRAPEEVVVPDLEHGRQGRIGRQVAADIRVVLVGAYHHGRGVPADQALDPPLDSPVAGIGDFFLGRNRVDIRRIPAQGDLNAQVRGAFHQAFEEVAGPVGPCLVDHLVEGFHPLGGLQRI